ncbi:hypothetical protein Sfulv_32910 [Streptomyces fulvorobeus]|uniref:Uncharacterized protein n=1 Tax=Streptomyces fulvorobeus TaxID=284028 RepID=A0A7J0C7J6_9ACTN|nr:hypothetical protein Sfulv_32910 [Streptomyces fulvorobeus]
MVPGRVLCLVVRLHRLVGRQRRHRAEQPLLGVLRGAVQHLGGRGGGRRGQRDLGGEQRDGVGDRVEAGGAQGLERGGVGARPGEGQLPFEEGPGPRGADAERGAFLVRGGGGRDISGAGAGGGGAGARQRAPGQRVQRFEQPGQPGGVRVLAGQRAGEPGQFRTELVGPVRVEQPPERVQGAADPAGRPAQRTGRLLGAAAAAVGGRAVLAVQPQAAQEVSGLLLEVRSEDLPAESSAASRVVVC